MAGESAHGPFCRRASGVLGQSLCAHLVAGADRRSKSHGGRHPGRRGAGRGAGIFSRQVDEARHRTISLVAPRPDAKTNEPSRTMSDPTSHPPGESPDPLDEKALKLLKKAL